MENRTTTERRYCLCSFTDLARLPRTLFKEVTAKLADARNQSASSGKRLAVFPTISAKVALVGGYDVAMPQAFGQNHRRGIGKVHRQIGLLAHQVFAAKDIGFVHLENAKSASPMAAQEAQGKWLAASILQRITRLGYDRQDGDGGGFF